MRRSQFKDKFALYLVTWGSVLVAIEFQVKNSNKKKRKWKTHVRITIIEILEHILKDNGNNDSNVLKYIEMLCRR